MQPLLEMLVVTQLQVTATTTRAAAVVVLVALALRAQQTIWEQLVAMVGVERSLRLLVQTSPMQVAELEDSFNQEHAATAVVVAAAMEERPQLVQWMEFTVGVAAAVAAVSKMVSMAKVLAAAMVSSSCAIQLWSPRQQQQRRQQQQQRCRQYWKLW
jgi:hypothetical protein